MANNSFDYMGLPAKCQECDVKRACEVRLDEKQRKLDDARSERTAAVIKNDKLNFNLGIARETIKELRADGRKKILAQSIKERG